MNPLSTDKTSKDSVRVPEDLKFFMFELQWTLIALNNSVAAVATAAYLLTVLPLLPLSYLSTVGEPLCVTRVTHAVVIKHPVIELCVNRGTRFCEFIRAEEG